MKKFLFLLISTFLFAKTEETCYTVQLTSFKLRKNSTYDFNAQNYPSSCRLIRIKSMHTVRCGCFDRYVEARNEQKKLAQNYPDTMILRTYKYRFKKKTIKKSPVQKRQTKTMETTSQVIVKEPTKIFPKTPASKIKSLVTAPKKDLQPKTSLEDTTQEKQIELLTKKSFTDYMSYGGNINITTQSYLIAPKDKNPENITLDMNLEAAYRKEGLKLYTKAKLQQDLADLEDGAEKTHRSYARIDELYAQYDLENGQVLLGKSLRFWGALEVRNIADVFNPYDLRADPFYKTKLGVINAEYTQYTETGEFSLIVQLYEQSREMSAYPYVYYYFPENVKYSKNLQSESGRYRPNVYLKYSDSYEGDGFSLDYSFVLQNGYDSQRYYTTHMTAKDEIETNEHAYLVNKFIIYDTLVSGATLYKLEAIYADVLNNDEISDYTHLGLGVEHTVPQVYKDADLGLLAEYYRYHSFEGEKRNDLQLFEVFQNDLFLGLRYSFNQGNDSSIVGGGIFDLDYSEYVYYLEYQTRVADSYKINFDYRYIEPSNKQPTVFNLMGRHERLSLKIGYYF